MSCTGGLAGKTKWGKKMNWKAEAKEKLRRYDAMRLATINIPQESVTIPETIDGIRAAMKMQATREEGTAMTNKYLKIGRFK